jgi:hypothetical protein
MIFCLFLAAPKLIALGKVHDLEENSEKADQLT